MSQELLNSGWVQPAAFQSRVQLAHLALREKARRHRALVRFLLDTGAWGVASNGRAAVAEAGEKIAAAGRLCELQVCRLSLLLPLVITRSMIT